MRKKKLSTEIKDINRNNGKNSLSETKRPRHRMKNRMEGSSKDG